VGVGTVQPQANGPIQVIELPGENSAVLSTRKSAKIISLKKNAQNMMQKVASAHGIHRLLFARLQVNPIAAPPNRLITNSFRRSVMRMWTRTVAPLIQAIVAKHATGSLLPASLNARTHRSNLM
jgi:hypothetical protein